MFWRGGNGHLWEAWGPANGSLSGPLDLGMGQLGSDPTAGVDARGNIYVYWQGSTGNHDLWEAYWNGARWSGPYDRGMGPLGSAPSVAVTPGGTAYVFWKGTGSGHNLWEAWGSAKGALNGPVNRGMGPLGSGPTAGTDGRGNIYVYWEGSYNGHLWEASGDGSTMAGPYRRVASALDGGVPSVTVTPGGTAYVFWKGPQGDLWEAQGSAKGSLSGPVDRGMGVLGSGPAAATDGKGNIYVYHQGAGNKHMWIAHYHGTTLVGHPQQMIDITIAGSAPTAVIYS